MKLHLTVGLFLALAPGLLNALPARAQTSDVSISAPGDLGIISVPSRHSVKVTSDRLEQDMRARGLKLFGRIDHKANAESARLALRPTTLILFEDLRLATQLLHQNQTLGLDLPLKFLVWETGDHEVYITWNNPYYLAQRHGLSPHLEALSQLSQTMVQLAKKAAA